MPASPASYLCAAVATANVTFTPGTLPQPAVDGIGLVNGQYFLLTDQTNPNQNGIWYCDPGGPVPMMTVQTGLDPAVSVLVTGGLVFNNTTWVYTASWRGGGQPGFVQA